MQSSASRIAINTLSTYVRLLVVALVGFAAVPIALRTLGTTDYGIYSLLGGSLAFLLFINGALTAGAERHFAHAIGRGDQEELSKWFTASVCLHLGWGCIMTIIGLLAGPWIVNHGLRIPSSRIAASMWAYRIVIFTMVAGVASTPFQAILMAHELVLIQAMVGILGAIIFAAGILLLPILPGDHLINYAFIYSSNQLVVFIVPVIYVLLRYPLCRRVSAAGLHLHSLRELLGFSSWNLLGALAGTIRSQGPAILINRSFGASVNASYGIALQVNGAMMNLGGAVYRSTIPQIIKSHSSGNDNRMIDLSCYCSKYSFILLWCVISPMLFNANFILAFWLHTPPPYAVSFFILLAVALLIDQLTSGFIAVVQAVGKLGPFQMTTSLLMCCGIPIGYLLIRLGMYPPAILWAGIVAAILTGLGIWWFAYKLGSVPPGIWWLVTLRPIFIITVCTSVLYGILNFMLAISLLRIEITVACDVVFVPFLLWQFGMSQRERDRIKALLSKILQKIGASSGDQFTAGS